MDMRITSIVIAAVLIFPASYAKSSEKDQSAAQRRVAWAEAAIAKDRNSHQAYNNLAMALAERARETADVSYYTQANDAVDKSLQLAPDNFEALKARAWILLGKHQFAEALKLSEQLNQHVPDDLQVYGFLVDANVELGNYRKAEEAAQQMLDRRPGNIPAYTRAAYLRELFGLIPGALELMASAYQRIPANEYEHRAWVLTQMAHLHLLTGDFEPAERLLDEALQLFPGYHYSLATLAEARTQQQKYSDAVDLLQKRFDAAPHPENLFALAEALERAGRLQEAEKAYAEFEEKGQAEVQNLDNANRELVFYYADRADKPREALKVAQLEVRRRRDVHTVDAYAWALFANGRFAEARQEIENAMAVGIRDAKIFYHAGAIASSLKDYDAATRYLRKSLDLNPRAEVSAAARQMLSRIERNY
jgi:tetratricopeptide (TPR) repeat protein